MKEERIYARDEKDLVNLGKKGKIKYYEDIFYIKLRQRQQERVKVKIMNKITGGLII